ncbi:hypothetical protein [Paenibacillus lentus]|uniref:PepSY domain-containing protein n=1 Tax=Paenibacillus lentus TaxID=1338368 RepID=A0A3Q8SDD9_9BACL|nr:hypothetical protein [Paenibacillus lentus]AZK47979.1 hypothetical protein EIM92_18890 [Paenibacillus lentus]
MLKKSFSLVIAVVMIIGMSTSVFASHSNASNEKNEWEIKLVEAAYNEIKGQIVKDYQELYKLDNFTYDFEARDDQNDEFFAINIYVDMTLTRHPSDRH